MIDTSTLTGEPLPVTVGQGMSVLSGTSNAGTPFEVRAGRPAAESSPRTRGSSIPEWLWLRSGR